MSQVLCLLNNYEKYETSVDKAYDYMLAYVRTQRNPNKINRGYGTNNWYLTFSILFLSEYSIAKGNPPEVHQRDRNIVSGIIFPPGSDDSSCP